MPSSDLIRALWLAGALLFAPAIATATDAPPARVVSINLCTDQLAMLIAAPGQLVSVSHLALDPLSSAMVGEAANYPVNHGLAEEIYLMQPDLVLVGRYSNTATTNMLTRLNIPVATFDIADTLDDVRDHITQMGEVLHQRGRAAALLADYDRRLATFRAETAIRPRAALYYANGYTTGDQTLAGQILLTAGFENIATEAGYPTGGRLPLEVLALSAPDAVIGGRPYPGASRAEEILHHPVLQRLRHDTARASATDSDWICGTPFVLNAIEDMTQLRHTMQEGSE